MCDIIPAKQPGTLATALLTGAKNTRNAVLNKTRRHFHTSEQLFSHFFTFLQIQALVVRAYRAAMQVIGLTVRQG